MSEKFDVGLNDAAEKSKKNGKRGLLSSRNKSFNDSKNKNLFFPFRCEVDD